MSAPDLDVDPWQVRESRIDLDPGRLGTSESIFALSNGFLGVRGTLDEDTPSEVRGTFCAGVFETYPLSYPEGGYGHPEEGQAMVSVADGTVIRTIADGTALDVAGVPPEQHERTLDLRTGTLDRLVRWRLPSGTTLEVRSRRMVSFAERSVCLVRYAVRAVDGPAHVVLSSELARMVGRPAVTKGDPRVAEALSEPFELAADHHHRTGGGMAGRTRRSGIAAAAVVDHVVQGGTVVGTELRDHAVRTTVSADLATGEEVVLTKVLGYAWQRDGEPDGMLDVAESAVASAIDRGWDRLLEEQGVVLEEFWESADVEIDGDAELQQALRYGLFQLFCAAARISGAPVGAKGLTGLGYDGHTFWDVEGFVVPALSLLRPEAAAQLLRWRAGTLDEARHRARVLDLAGATFAWRTIDGRECSPYWPASTAAMHVNADICRAFWLHHNVTASPFGDLSVFQILVETARLWISMGHRDADGGWHLLGMTGPDEYTGVVDDNVFTNLMARRNLGRAAEAVEAAPGLAAELGVTAEEVEEWRDAARSVHVTWDERLGVHPMNEGFTTYREWRFADHRDSYPLQEHHHYAKIYRRQVLKQADLVLALWWCREEFTDEQVARNLDYYEARTVRDSSLSAAAQAVVCAHAGHPDLALRYLRECALVDLRDVQGDTAEGLHLAAVAGAWLALVQGLGGMRDDQPELELAPRLPTGLSRTAYHLTWRGTLLRVETTREGTTVSARRGEGPVTVRIDGHQLQVDVDAPVTRPLVASAPLLPEPRQPVGREPRT